MARYPKSTEPPKPAPPDDGNPIGPAEPPKPTPPDDGNPTGPAEPAKATPQEDSQTLTGQSAEMLVQFEAPQAPMEGRRINSSSPNGSEAIGGSSGEFSAPQAPGPSGDTGAP